MNSKLTFTQENRENLKKSSKISKMSSSFPQNNIYLADNFSGKVTYFTHKKEINHTQIIPEYKRRIYLPSTWFIRLA